MKHSLLLGPGHSRHRIHGGPYFGSIPNELISVADRSADILADWREAEKRYSVDLQQPPFPFPPSYYDEIHAYEVLNLLPGDEIDFFNLWRSLWDTLNPGGKVFVTVPHWQSQWIHGYPAPQRVYTVGLLAYLDSDKKISAKENFELWEPPYNFTLESAYDVGEPPQGFYFTLVKNAR